MIVCGWFTSMRMKQRCRWWRNIRAGETGWTSVFTGMVMREKETRAVMVSEEHCLWQSILNASTVQSICKEAAKVATAKGFGKKWKWLQHIQSAFVNQQTAEVVPSTATCKRAKEAGSRQTKVKWIKCDGLLTRPASRWEAKAVKTEGWKAQFFVMTTENA